MKTFADSFNAFFEGMEYFGMGFSDRYEKVIGFTKYGNARFSKGTEGVIKHTYGE